MQFDGQAAAHKKQATHFSRPFSSRWSWCLPRKRSWNYPDGKGPMRGAKVQERFRGKHQLQRDENGLEKCVACFLCAAACPSNCIYIEAAENTEEVRISSAERYAKVYNIDYNRCIFC